MTTAPPPPRTAADLTLADLATVRRLRDRSTKWVNVFAAASDRGVATYAVKHETRDDDGRRYRPEYWSCNCPASPFRPCKHMLRSWGREQADWWARLYADYTPSMLHSERAAKLALVRAGLDEDESRAALLATAGLLAELGEEAA